MKKLKTLEDALKYQLQGLYFTEKKVQEEFAECRPLITSGDIRTELTKYIESADSKLLKLERIFNYVLENDLERKNEVISQMLDETHNLVTLASSAQLRDILMITCAQTINAYKTASYRTAYLLAMELELDTAADLLHEIIGWELQTGEMLSTLVIEEFNKANQAHRAT